MITCSFFTRPDAGIEGIFCGLSAIYACVAHILNEVYRMQVLPL